MTAPAGSKRHKKGAAWLKIATPPGVLWGFLARFTPFFSPFYVRYASSFFLPSQARPSRAPADIISQVPRLSPVSGA